MIIRRRLGARKGFSVILEHMAPYCGQFETDIQLLYKSYSVGNHQNEFKSSQVKSSCSASPLSAEGGLGNHIGPTV